MLFRDIHGIIIPIGQSMGKFVVKHKFFILLLALLSLIPSFIGMMLTRVNYDMLSYLPSDMETVIGQNELLEDFGKGAFSMIITEDLPIQEQAILEKKIKEIDHVDTVLGFGTIEEQNIPAAMLPDELYNKLRKDNESLIAVFFDTSTSADETLSAVSKIRKLMDDHIYVSGMSAFVVDLKEISNSETLVYIAVAVTLALVVMFSFLDNWLTPIIFLTSIGIMILINLGTNIIFGEISYVTKALSAVLQLAVTMDYSIFLWHSYRENLEIDNDSEKAMVRAIKATFKSVIGSSATTVAGFIALCFMTFTMGLDLGLVMAKGVILGVIGSITVLPAIILVLDKYLKKCNHKSLLPDFKKLSEKIVKFFPALLIIFIAILPPAIYGYIKTNNNVNYNISSGLSNKTPSAIANTKLEETFGLSNVHMILTSANLEESNARAISNELKNVSGIKTILNLENLIGDNVPFNILPDQVKNIFRSDKWELTLLVSEYKTATDEIATQIEEINSIIKTHDSKALLIGESSCTQDMIKLTSNDFRVVNTVSIGIIFIIIALVTMSASLPVILIVLIEMAIFVNLAISFYTGKSLSFIAPVCISTIQLGATVDYAILMTSRYMSERKIGKTAKKAATIALSTSIPSIIISGAVLFAATIGVAIYSNAELVSSLCMLLARGAVISIFVVPLFLPPLLIFSDKIIIRTTKGYKKLVKRSKKHEARA